MSHNIPHEEAKKKDNMIIRAILKLDETGMLSLVREQGVTGDYKEVVGYASVMVK